MPSLTTAQKLANQKYFESIIRMTNNWIWKDEGELFEIEDGKFVPQTQNGNAALRRIVSKHWASQFIKS
jgi:hypothetical protein